FAAASLALFVLRYRGRAGAGEVGAENCFRFHSGSCVSRDALVLAGLSGRAYQVPPEAFAWPASGFVHAFTARSLGFGSGLRAHHPGDSRDRLALSSNFDQWRRVKDRADIEFFPG